MENTQTSVNLFDVMNKVSRLYTARMLEAQKNFLGQIQKPALDPNFSAVTPPENPFQTWNSYMTDAMQRSVLFWDIMRERGNIYLEQVREGNPPLLAFKWEIIADARTFERPVNYALARIIPPEGVKLDETRRPFIIVDPRAGQGPGIGGFKRQSEVGVALQFGHPVYCVIFFTEPEPGQTILDISAA